MRNHLQPHIVGRGAAAIGRQRGGAGGEGELHAQGSLREAEVHQLGKALLARLAQAELPVAQVLAAQHAQLLAAAQGGGLVEQGQRGLVLLQVVGTDALVHHAGGDQRLHIAGLDRIARLGGLAGLDVALRDRVAAPGRRLGKEGRRRAVHAFHLRARDGLADQLARLEVHHHQAEAVDIAVALGLALLVDGREGADDQQGRLRQVGGVEGPNIELRVAGLGQLRDARLHGLRGLGLHARHAVHQGINEHGVARTFFCGSQIGLGEQRVGGTQHGLGMGLSRRCGWRRGRRRWRRGRCGKRGCWRRRGVVCRRCLCVTGRRWHRTG